jgi:hypothetical protein
MKPVPIATPFMSVGLSDKTIVIDYVINISEDKIKENIFQTLIKHFYFIEMSSQAILIS